MSGKYLQPGAEIRSAELGDGESKALLESHWQALQERLAELPEDAGAARRAALLEGAHTLLRLERGAEAWELARAAFDLALADQDWEAAVQSCERLYEADRPDSVAALGQGIWLAVTYPVDPDLSVAMLQHLIDETPPDADGAAVAAAAAHYVVELRAEGRQHEDLSFFTGRMLGTVARRHSQVETQEQFDAWMSRLELDDPAKFLVRLRNVVDVMVQDHWWFDRDALRERLPVN